MPKLFTKSKLGLFPYLKFLLHLRSQFPRRRFVFLELRHVSMQLDDQVPTIDETFASIQEIYANLGIAVATWMGHSLGTLVCAWICRDKPEWIGNGGVIFLDPVVFCLWECDVSRNFLYKKPVNGIVSFHYYYDFSV